MTLRSAVAFAETVVDNDDAPTPALQNQARLQQWLQIHDPAVVGSEDWFEPMAVTSTQHLPVSEQDQPSG
ncbi:MAG: hypothetical protein GY722_29385 [bacterium]|nr:hypothetical protein [bacterium]